MPLDFAGLVGMEPGEKEWITQNMIENQLRPDTREGLEPPSRLGSYGAGKMGNCRLLTLGPWERMIAHAFLIRRVPPMLLLSQLPQWKCRPQLYHLRTLHVLVRWSLHNLRSLLVEPWFRDNGLHKAEGNPRCRFRFRVKAYSIRQCVENLGWLQARKIGRMVATNIADLTQQVVGHVDSCCGYGFSGRQAL